MTTSSKKTSSSSVVNSLAKIFDPNALKNQRLPNEEEPAPACPLITEDVNCPENMSGLDAKVASLDQKINILLTVQDNVLQKLDYVSQEISSMGNNIDLLNGKEKNSGVSIATPEKLDVNVLCIEMNEKLLDMTKNAEQQAKRLDGLEHVVMGVHQLLGSLVEKLKTSSIMDLMRRNESPRKLVRVGGYLRKDKSGNLFRMQTFSDKKETLFCKWNDKEKSCLTAKGIKSIIKKKKPPDSSEESDDTEKVHKLNKENAEKASPFFVQRSFPKSLSHELKEKSVASHWKPPLQKAAEKSQAEDNAKETHNKQSGQDTKGLGKKNEECGASSGLGKDIEGTDSSSDKERKALETTPESEDTSEDVGPSKSQDQDVEHKDCGKTLFLLEDEQSTSNDSPPPPAPFDHRIVSAKRMGINSYYHVYKGEVLGGGRFGQVHKCEEKSTGIQLAAKIIKARNIKEKDEVKNEINVMNQLDHVNLIQLYDAFESKNDIVLVMEYVQGGELFDRIIDENCNLTEIDTILFTKQICEGIQYMHRMYILHLDLKPENILCVNREANQIKIIDFGLARRYKPREKLKVNFGTPEFLAPEVVNYDFVSFPTDMWSVGVIAYMLLSGLSPFLGEDDNETLNNILACRWDFEDEEFANVSEDAKDFITKLLIKEKGWRISATAALKHPWLSDQKLHGRLLTQKKAKNSSTSQALEAP